MGRPSPNKGVDLTRPDPLLLPTEKESRGEGATAMTPGEHQTRPGLGQPLVPLALCLASVTDIDYTPPLPCN